MSDLHTQDDLSEEQRESRRNHIRSLFRAFYHRLEEDKIFKLPEGIEDDHIFKGFERELPVDMGSLAAAFRRCLKNLPRGFIGAEVIEEGQGFVSWRLWHITPRGDIGEIGEYGTLEFSTMRDGFSRIFYSGLASLPANPASPKENLAEAGTQEDKELTKLLRQKDFREVTGWDEFLIRLWNKGHNYRYISERINNTQGLIISPERVNNRKTELRKAYGEDVVPKDPARKKKMIESHYKM